MRLKYKDSSDIFTQIEYKSEKNCFVLKSPDGNQIEYEPKLKLNNKYPVSQFSFYFLENQNPSCTENSIYQVYVESVRIGWIFPLQALCSAEHDKAEDPYFLMYAYAACAYLLDQVNSIDKYSTPELFGLEDYYSSTSILLVVDLENIQRIPSFNIDEYFVSLYEHGYSCKGKGNMFADGILEPSRKNIHLSPVSKDVDSLETINYIFQDQLPLAENSISTFYWIYQLVEFLINIVFEVEFQKMVADISREPDKLFEHKETLSEISSEKIRIKELFETYAHIDATDAKNALNEACIKLLEENHRKTHPQWYNNLYAVRCLIVHKLYSLSPDSIRLIEDINKPFLEVSTKMLYGFSKKC